MLPARAVLLVGRAATAAMLGRPSDDVLYTCLPLFHTNALNAFVQALSPRRGRSRRPALLRVALLGSRRAPPTRRSPICWGDGQHPHVAPGVPADARTECAPRWRPATPADASTSVPRALRRAARRGLRLDGDELRRSASAGASSARGGWAACATASRHASSTRTTRRCARRRRASWCCAATTRSRSPPATSACPRRPSESWRNLWFHTGDRVVRDADGWFRVHGPPQGRHPAPRREHLVLRGRAGAAGTPGRRVGGGFPVRVGAGRGRGRGVRSCCARGTRPIRSR